MIEKIDLKPVLFSVVIIESTHMKAYPIAELLANKKFLKQVEQNLDKLDPFQCAMMNGDLNNARKLIDKIEQESANGDDFSKSVTDLEDYIIIIRRNYSMLGIHPMLQSLGETISKGSQVTLTKHDDGSVEIHITETHENGTLMETHVHENDEFKQITKTVTTMKKK